MKKIIFITGVTGFLGGEMLVMLSKMTEIEKIFCLVRAADLEAAWLRLDHVFDFHGDFLDSKKVIPVVGDMVSDDLGEALVAHPELLEVNTVIHAAANTSFSSRDNDLVEKVNVGGTQQILAWASKLPGLKTFVYVGTASICGKDIQGRVVHEDESPNEGARHLVRYTQTKMTGELMAREAIPKEKLLVVRPSVIMGDSRGIVPRSFVIMWAFAAGKLLRVVPMNEEDELDIIPIDFAAEAIIRLTMSSHRRYDTYHISAGAKSKTTMASIMSAITAGSDGLPVKFLPYESISKLRSWARGKLDEEDPFYLENSLYFNYMEYILGKKGNLRMLLAGLDAYYKFGELSQVFDNSRLLADTGIELSQPAHVYMGNPGVREVFSQINIFAEAIAP